MGVASQWCDWHGCPMCVPSRSGPVDVRRRSREGDRLQPRARGRNPPTGEGGRGTTRDPLRRLCGTRFAARAAPRTAPSPSTRGGPFSVSPGGRFRMSLDTWPRAVPWADQGPVPLVAMSARLALETAPRPGRPALDGLPQAERLATEIARVPRRPRHVRARDAAFTSTSWAPRQGQIAWRKYWRGGIVGGCSLSRKSGITESQISLPAWRPRGGYWR